jgi:hypothetical protein
VSDPSNAKTIPRGSASSIMERMSRHISIDRDAVSAFCRRHHIMWLALFGSVLRDDFGPTATSTYWWSLRPAMFLASTSSESSAGSLVC